MQTQNEYQQAIDPEFFERCPKAIFAALAVGFLLNFHQVPLSEITRSLHAEWESIDDSGIVPQKPSRLKPQK